MVVYFGHEVEKALKNTWKFGRISLLWQGMNTLSSTLPSEKGLASRLLKIW